VSCTDHDFQPHPNHDHRRCIHCGTTPDEAVDDLLDEAEDAVAPGRLGTQPEKNRRAIRLLTKALREAL